MKNTSHTAEQWNCYFGRRDWIWNRVTIRVAYSPKAEWQANRYYNRQEYIVAGDYVQECRSQAAWRIHLKDFSVRETESARMCVCFVHHYEYDWRFPMCVLQCQCGEHSRWPGHRNGYGVSPEPPQRARERAGAEESSRNWAWVLSAGNRWIP